MDSRIEFAINQMRLELNRDLSLDQIAQSVNLSVSYLHHLFRSETGTTPWLYLQSLRLEKAQELLTTTMMSVKQIMVLVGMKDKSHFGRTFKKTFGRSPTEYRAAARLNRYLQKI